MPPNPRLLLVEGKDDKFVIAELFEKATGQKWEPIKGKYLVDIEWDAGDDDPKRRGGGDAELLNQLSVKWRESGRLFVGLVIDADTSMPSRWSQVRAKAPLVVQASLPDQTPADGLVVNVDDDGIDRRFGAWLMPDNQTSGAMETFLKYLRPSNPTLDEHARESMRKARDEHRAPWRPTHTDKAEIHTWLAWQDPPGQQLHLAVRTETLKTDSAIAQRFVAWMKRLYGI